MIERIERTERIKGIDRNESRDKRKSGYDDNAPEKKFSDFLKKAAKTKPAERPAKIGEAYRLEVGRATQSLFYEGGLDFKSLRRNLSAYL
ncbi:MAG: hypothetical protein IKN12_03980 [Selenomonadaceae bacterium]|nr:hypothetical protein [Selenomonadaceae bacterium]MBR3721903.1 hypothetical protein [Selenomonadaceae bacterium]